MMKSNPVAIIDYGVGNVFSVRQACQFVGLNAEITSDPLKVLNASAIILPGVGAFGDAMAMLKQSKLTEVLKEAFALRKPMMGICLGMQLLMTESYEFGRHEGLNLIPGKVIAMDPLLLRTQSHKVPHIGWSPIVQQRSWAGTPLSTLKDGDSMYFVHSFYVEPEDYSMVLSTTYFGSIQFCSSLQYGHFFGCQFHPEKSGPRGLKIYSYFAHMIQNCTTSQVSFSG